MDAPVLGNRDPAKAQKIFLLVSGKKAAIEFVQPMLDVLGQRSFIIGEAPELSAIMKPAGIVMTARTMQMVGEALVLATKAGVDPEVVYKAIRGGLAGSTVFDAKALLMLARNFNPRFRINLHIEDLTNVLETSHGVGVGLPLTAAVMEMLQALKVDGLGDADHGAIVRFYEKLAQVEVKPNEAAAAAKK